MTVTDPLVPPEIDLRDFGFIPLDVARLRDSELSTGDAEVFRVAVLSWCVSWHQRPAASLPDDDATLARILGFGRDLRSWKRVRAAGGMRGWIKCSDGRLYHPVVAEKALTAWKGKQAQRARTEAARLAREQQRQAQQQRQHASVTDTVTDTVTDSKGERQGEGEGEDNRKNTSPPSPGVSPPDSPAAATAALRKRVKGLKTQDVRDAVLAGSLYRLLVAFGANVDGERPNEWQRDCDDLQLGVVAGIFAWMRWRRDPIREPSGFRRAHEAWLAMAKETRTELLDRLLPEFGLIGPAGAA